MSSAPPLLVSDPAASAAVEAQAPAADALSGLRIALFNGNYNMTVDGANRALNRLVGYLLRHGAKVRVYSATIDNPAFEPTGDLVSVPSLPIPGRSEYRAPAALSPRVRRDLAAFAPNVVHLSSPDFVSHRVLNWAKARGLPVLASVHTRFETYLRYYRLAWLEPLMVAVLRRYYRRCDALVAPSESFADVLREQRMNSDISLWTRGVDRTVFNSQARSLEWRRGLGIADSDFVVGFVGRLVLEKGLDVFADTVDELNRSGVPHKVLVIGDGPARAWFEARLPGAIFAGFQSGSDLGKATASMDVLLNPSVTEAFGNVTLEAMACRLPVVAARATGSESLVRDGISGRLCTPGAIDEFASGVRAYAEDAALADRHGAAGEAFASDCSWDRINQAVADTYLRLLRQKAATR
jgi:glycosyltransferase involved in cell wall biosynthesis